MNPEIARELNPNFQSDQLKWSDVFKNISIAGDADIPINKRGSGVKRLILLNFFRAEAERRKNERNVSDVIYAIEEPETSQHPDHQTKLIKALLELSKTDNTQVILTTHSPPIVKMLEFEHLRLVKKNGQNKEISNVDAKALPYPSLNEINYSVFLEPSTEYHNELYGWLFERYSYDENKAILEKYCADKSKRSYSKLNKRGNVSILPDMTLTEYIRHQIHHPENKENRRFTDQELLQSIKDMKKFIKTENAHSSMRCAS